MKMNKNVRIVVFDDDPTGIQTVHGCLLVTDWSDENLVRAFEDRAPFFYILTNSRALTEDDARHVLTDAMEAVLRVNERYGFRLICISRSDSCLRGHFRMETDVMRSLLTAHGKSVMPLTPFCPAFIESGRVTIDGTHYMKQGDKLIPTSETEFARDNVFGYSTSVLHDYIKEKGADPSLYEIVNAQSYDELNAYRDRLFAAINDYDAIVIRSSSSLPRALSCIDDKPFLSREDLGIDGKKPGMFIVGSHVRKTTEQLTALLSSADATLQPIELPIEGILDAPEKLMEATMNNILSALRKGITPVVFTARKEVRIDDVAKRQRLGQDVSNFLVDIVHNVVAVTPLPLSYLVAKGGITSHDILTHGLNVKVGRVMGQAINSVPCVMASVKQSNQASQQETQQETQLGSQLASQLETQLPYIIFPGNVGNEQSLKEIYGKLGVRG